jgi:hypothetical protein
MAASMNSSAFNVRHRTPAKDDAPLTVAISKLILTVSNG